MSRHFRELSIPARRFRFLAKLVGCAAIFFGAIYLLDVCIDRSRRGFEGRLEISFPSDGTIVGLHRDTFGFDGSRSWLVKLGSANKWWPSLDFHECPYDASPSEDYNAIVSIAKNEFPAYKDRFVRPRVWRGGRDGNTYVVMSDDGVLVWFHYFWT
ncbi:MAG: hypothetical protein AB1705_04225 [Verrucomicrobiota bacterium]